MNAPGDLPESGDEWDAAWLEFHAAWRPRLRAFLTSVCDDSADLVEDILRVSLLQHRRQWATLDDLDLAHVLLFEIVLDQVRAFRGQASVTPLRSTATVLHELVELPVEDIAAATRTSVRVVRMHLALGDQDHPLVLATPELDGVDHGVALLRSAYDQLTVPRPGAADDEPEADYALGLVCEQRGDLRGAALCFQRATAHNFEDAAERFVSVLAQLSLPSRGRHALADPPPAADPGERLALEALVVASGVDVEGLSLSGEARAVCALCGQARGVVEVAAMLGMSLEVVRDVVGELASLGLVVVHESGVSAGVMERVRVGLLGL